MRKGVIGFLAGLFLITFIWPFSYLPNPLGIAYWFVGGYTYDPRIPFLVNGFLTLGRGDVNTALSAKLDELVRTTGLDPLDPNQPLKGYEIETITYGAGDWAYGGVRMLYADGSTRRYRIPVVQHSQSWGRPGGWAYTGLDRYLAPHRELPDIPFAGPDSPMRLGTPERLPLDDQTHHLGAGLLHAWYTSSERRGEEMVWSPLGDAFLLSTQPDPRERQTDTQLWLVQLDNRNATKIATNAEHYTWSADGERIAFLRLARPPAMNQQPLWEVVAVDRKEKGERVLGQTDLPVSPAIIGDMVWYPADNALWRSSYTDGKAIRTADLPGLQDDHFSYASFALAPDGQRLAYRCGDALCLVDTNGQDLVRVDLGAPPRAPTPTPVPFVGRPEPAPTLMPASKPPAGPAPQRPAFAKLELAWSQDSDRLAAVASDYQAMPTLRIIDPAGSILQRIVIGPDGFTRPPQWTPDGRWLFLNTFSWGGRRILAVEVETGQLLDLSQPRWDTFFSLAPDGRSLLLWNGRGGFWTVGVEGN